jgi:hypothetical protein
MELGKHGAKPGREKLNFENGGGKKKKPARESGRRKQRRFPGARPRRRAGNGSGGRGARSRDEENGIKIVAGHHAEAGCDAER